MKAPLLIMQILCQGPHIYIGAVILSPRLYCYSFFSLSLPLSPSLDLFPFWSFFVLSFCFCLFLPVCFFLFLSFFRSMQADQAAMEGQTVVLV